MAELQTDQARDGHTGRQPRRQKQFGHIELYILWRAMSEAEVSLANYAAPKVVKRLRIKVEQLMRESK